MSRGYDYDYEPAAVFVFVQNLDTHLSLLFWPGLCMWYLRAPCNVKTKLAGIHGPDQSNDYLTRRMCAAREEASVT